MLKIYQHYMCILIWNLWTVSEVSKSVT